MLQKARPGQRTSVHFGLLHMVCLPLVKPTLFSCPWQSVNRGHSVKVAALEESPWAGVSIDGTNTCYGPGSVIWTSLNIYPFHMWNEWDYPWWNPTNLWCQSVDKSECAGSIPYCYAEGHSLKCSKLYIIALYSVFALWIKLCFVLVYQTHSLPLSKQNHCLKWLGPVLAGLLLVNRQKGICLVYRSALLNTALGQHLVMLTAQPCKFKLNFKNHWNLPTGSLCTKMGIIHGNKCSLPISMPIRPLQDPFRGDPYSPSRVWMNS